MSLHSERHGHARTREPETGDGFGYLVAVATALAVVAAGLAVGASGPPVPDPSTVSNEGDHERDQEGYANLPPLFVENRGQTDGRVRYHAQGSGYGF